MTLFYITYAIWFLSEIVLNRIMRSGNADKKNQDKGSLLIIWITISIAIAGGVISAQNFNTPIGQYITVSYTGLFLIIAGMIIRFTAVRSLGKMFTVDVTIRENHKIKQGGIYKLIRHPSYTGSLLSFAGFGLSLNNRISLLISVVLVPLAFLYRIRIEEKALTDQFGTDYLEYKKRTYRLIPFIY